MTIKEAIKQRHMVRKYTDKPIPSNLVELLNARIAENNTTHGLNMKLVIGNSDGIGGMAKMLLTKTVHSYIVLAGKENSDLDEKLGYCGADLCLYVCSDSRFEYMVVRRYVQRKRCLETS